jgi:hypothetical protein
MIPNTKRDHTYIWSSWLSKILAGEQSCHYAPWLRANYKIETARRGDTEDDKIKDWTLKHTTLLEETKAEYEAAGYTCYVEDQAAFCLTGKTGISVAGKCDIVAIRGEDCVVIDVKTGRVRLSDYAQVQIYIIALQHVPGPWSGKLLRGLIVYPKGTKPVDVPPENIDRDNFKKAVTILSSDVEPKRAPSYQGCHYCEITGTDCPQRVTEKPKASQTDLF